MDIKDQLRIQMEKMQISVGELAKRVGVSQQSVRYWLDGRNFPGKAKTFLLERELSVKLDYSEGAKTQGPTVESSLAQTDIETFIEFQKLPAEMKLVFAALARGINQLSQPTIEAQPSVRVGELVDSRGYANAQAGSKRKMAAA